jgi:hypothetical protein
MFRTKHVTDTGKLRMGILETPIMFFGNTACTHYTHEALWGSRGARDTKAPGSGDFEPDAFLNLYKIAHSRIDGG